MKHRRNGGCDDNHHPELFQLNNSNNSNNYNENDAFDDHEKDGPKSVSSRRSRSRRMPVSSQPQRNRRTLHRIHNDDNNSDDSARSSNNTGVAVRRRAPHQFDHTKEEARPFINAIRELSNQTSNENNAKVFSFFNNDNTNNNINRLKFDSNEVEFGVKVEHAHFEMMSLDDLFPSCAGRLSSTFHCDESFRHNLRNAMREDIFDSTPTYSNLSPKARKMLLLPDSSLQGSWRCHNSNTNDIRMKKLTKVLKDSFGSDAPTGDDFMNTIGSLCGDDATTHWIDIVGVLDRRVPHSWHQDTGRIYSICKEDNLKERSKQRERKTVMLGFPAEDYYDGVGVFSHVVKLQEEAHASQSHPDNEPILYQGSIDEEYIVRPRFAAGREILVYRDVDVLHSAPDVAYRSSVMRFM